MSLPDRLPHCLSNNWLVDLADGCMHKVTLGIVDSEGGRGRKEDFKLYRSCHKIQLLLWVVTNSYRYTRSTFDQMCEWETASDWEMAMNKELLFTKEVSMYVRHNLPLPAAAC